MAQEVIQEPTGLEDPVTTIGNLAGAIPAMFDDLDDPAKKSGALDGIDEASDITGALMSHENPDVQKWAMHANRQMRYEFMRRSGDIERIQDQLRADMGAWRAFEVLPDLQRGSEEFEAEYTAMGERLRLRKDLLNDSLVGMKEGFGGDRFTGNDRGYYRGGTEVVDVPVMAPDAWSEWMEPAYRNRQILNSEIEEIDGFPYAKTDYGLIALPDFRDNPELRGRLRESLLGIAPGSMNLVRTGAVTTELPKRLSELTGLGPQGDGVLWDVETAWPEIVFPWNPMLFGVGKTPEEDEALAQRSADALKDPRVLRGVQEVVRDMQEKGEIEATFGEDVAQIGLMMGEFIAVNRALGAVAGKGLGRAASSERLRRLHPMAAGAANVSNAWWKMMTVPGQGAGRFWSGVQFGFRNVVEEVVYEVARYAAMGNFNFASAIASGTAEGMFEMAADVFLARPLRGGLVGLHRRMNMPGSAWSRSVRDAKGNLRLADTHWERIRRSSPLKGTVEQQIARTFKDVRMAEQVQKTMDAVIVGAVFGAYEDIAMSGVDFWGLGLTDQAIALREGLTSQRAAANALVYGATGGFWWGREHFDTELNQKQKDSVSVLTAQVFDTLLNGADSMPRFREYAKFLEEHRAAYPDQFPAGAEVQMPVPFAQREFERYGQQPPPPGGQGDIGDVGPEGPTGPRPAPVSPPPPAAPAEPTVPPEEIESGPAIGHLFPGKTKPSEGGERLAWVGTPTAPGAPARWPEAPTGRRGFARMQEMSQGWEYNERSVQWELQGSTFEVHRGAEGYAIWHREGERAGMPVEGTQLHETLEGALAQANRIAQSQGSRPKYTTPQTSEPTGEPPSQPERDAATRQLGMWEIVREFDQMLEAALEADREGLQAKRDALAKQVVFEARAAKRADDASLGLEMEPEPAEAAPLARELTEADLVATAAAHATIEDPQATIDAHATDPEHLGKSPLEILGDEQKKRGRPRAPTVSSQQRSLAAKRGMPDRKRKLMERDLQSFVRAQGGLDSGDPGFTSEAQRGQSRDFIARHKGRLPKGTRPSQIPGTTGQVTQWEGFNDLKPEIGLSRLVQRPGKGLSTERMMLLALDHGYFPGETYQTLTYEKFAEALEQNRKPDDAREDEVKTLQEEYDASQQAAWDYYESQRPEGLMAGSPEYDSDLAQQEAGRLSPEVRFGQASVSADIFLEMAQAAGVLPDQATHTGPETVRLMWEMATSGAPRVLEALEGEPRTKDPEAAYATMRKRAQDYFAYMQLGARALAHADPSDENGNTMAETVDLFMEATHELAELGELTPETQAGLKRLGLLNEHGGLESGVPGVIGEWLDHTMRQIDQGATDLMWSASPLALSIPFGSSGVMGDEFVAFKLFRLDKVLNKLQNEALRPGQGGTAFGQGLDRIIWKAIRRPLALLESKIADHWGNSIATSRVQVLRRRAVNKSFRKAEAKHSNVIWNFEHILGQLAFRGHRLTRSQGRKFVQYIDRGIYKRDKNGDEAAHFYGEDHRFFFDAAKKVTEAVREMAFEGVQTGWLSDAAAAKLDAQYIMRASIHARDMEREAGLGASQMSFFMPRRDMSREESGQNDMALEIMDPYHLLARQSAQEASLTMLWGILGDGMDQGTAVAPHEMDRPSGEWVQRDIEWFHTAAQDDGKGTPAYNRMKRDPVTQHKLVGFQRRLYRMLRDEYARMQPRAEWVAGKLPDGSKTSYTERKEATLRHYLGPKFDGQGGALVTLHAAKELDMVLRRFDQPDIGPISEKWNAFMRYWRGNNTVRNSVHLFRNVVDTVFTNYNHGGAHFLDFMESVIVGRGVFTEGSYAKAARQALDFQDWAEAGKPKVKPDGWTQEKWEGARLANQAAELWMGATYVGALLGEGQHAIRDIVGQFTDAEQMRFGLFEQIEAREEDQNTTEELQAIALGYTARISPAMGRTQARWMEKIGTPNAIDKVEAQMGWGATYQAIEVWMALAQANTIKARNPNMSWERVLLKAKEGSRDYRAASGTVRDFSTNFEWSTSAFWNGTENTPQWMRLTARVALSTPFMIYPMGMLPQLIRNAAAHPIRALASTAFMMSVVQAMWAAAGSAEEERMEWEALADTPNAANLPFVDEKGAQELEQRLRLSLRSYGVHATDAQLETLTRMWIRMLYASPDVVPAPGNRMSDLADLAPPFGEMFKLRRTIRDGHEGDWIEFWDAALPNMAGMLFSGALEVFNPPSDTTRGEAIWSRGRKLMAQVLPQLNSETWLFSRQGQRIWELAALGGMDSGEYMLQGIRSMRPPTDETLVAEALFGLVRPSRKKSDYLLVGDRSNLWSKVMGGLYPELDRTSKQSKRRAVVIERVGEQWRQTLRDTYNEWMDGYALTPLRPDEVPHFDLRLNQQNFLQDIDMGAWQAGYARLKPEDQLVTEVGKQIARIGNKNPEDEGLAIRTTMTFFESAAYSRSAKIMMRAARRREISTGMFIKLYDAALRDPNGLALLYEIHKEVVVQKRTGRIDALFPIFLEIPEPNAAAGTEAWRHYQELFGRRGFDVRYREPPSGPAARIQDLYPGQGASFGAIGADLILKGKRKR